MAISYQYRSPCTAHRHGSNLNPTKPPLKETAKIMTTITRDGVTYLCVNTTNGSDVPVGFSLITANLRETKDSKITPEQKHRNVVIPEFSLPQVEDKFRSVLLEKFYELAKSYLEAKMEESNRMLREIPAADFSIDSLLRYFSERVQSSRMTGEAVAAWFDASATIQALTKRFGDSAEGKAKLQKVRTLYVKTASPNHGINPKTCESLLATLDDGDKESAIYTALATKWNATIQKSQASEVDFL